MDEFWQFLCQLDLCEQLPISASDPVLYFAGYWVNTPQMFIPPVLVSPQVSFTAVVPEDFEGPLGLYRKVLFTHVAPDHVWIVNRISWPGDERSRPPNFCKEFFAHRDPALLWTLGADRYFGPSLPFRGGVQCLFSNLGKVYVLTTGISIKYPIFGLTDQRIGVRMGLGVSFLTGLQRSCDQGHLPSTVTLTERG